MSSPISMSLDFRVRTAYWLRFYRSARKWTQQQAAEEFGAPMRANEISRYENAHNRPSEGKLFRFAEIYRVDISAFYAPLPDEEEGAT